MTYHHCLTGRSANKFWNKVEVVGAVLGNYAEMDVDSLNLVSDYAVQLANNSKDTAVLAINYFLNDDNVRFGGLELALEKLRELQELRRCNYNVEF